MIKMKKQDIITFDADKLELYLARNGLSRDEAKAATLDEDGKVPGCIKMDELLRIQNDYHFGMNFQPEEGKIYVLVVVPEGAVSAVGLLSVEQVRISSELFLLMLPHVLMECPTTISSRNPHFKANLCDFYNCYRRKYKWIQCMLLGISFPASIVAGAHLFRRSNEYLSNCLMQISDIDDVRNGLLLFKPLEHAFDHFQISFIYDQRDDCFYLKLFDPSIANTPIINLMRDPNQMQVLMDAINRAKKPCKFDPQTTFGDLDGMPLKLDKVNRPYNRCLNLQARLAYTKAMKNQVIDPGYNFNDFWSEGWSLEVKMSLFQQSIENCDQI
ncbi:Aste57867_21400 [Aphanomyces stellatus]|uniref:Aste57867_21400 protein n=1 Tax=Aphanomyces stellatus TaxID=120398 RepID=A0A485LHD0_9STRA|nr:hypothetical protein As57867_021331 [Aphanomyces stellatus]VFT98071.1 Aste57867_21400 [Aphanomyces stellatus]